jgi:hypothetical protein
MPKAEKREPVRIRVYGLVSVSKRGYLTLVAIGLALLVVLLAVEAYLVWLWAPAEQGPAAVEVGGWLLLLRNLHWLVLAAVILQGIEALIVLRRFARAEALHKVASQGKTTEAV